MKIDTEAQRKLLLTLLGRVPIQTTLTGLFAGPSPEVKALVQAIEKAAIEEEKTDG